MSTRESTLRAVLWAILGSLAVVTVARFARGLGATTALSDAAPWGMWIAFDVMAGVALAAGGFVTAATVYIFGRERYRQFVRPAILTAFLGYVAVAVGLVYDLGLPWRIWHPAVFPQPRSALFEVAMCVMLYLTVLLLEFSPVVLEHRWFDRPLLRKIHSGLKRATIPLVITGIVLSTLHQSSLGSLFLITPHRLHPLWYSPIIWVLFLFSAVGLGLMMVALESFFTAWLFGHRLRLDLLAGLGKAAAVVLAGYAAVRVGDLAVRGELGRVFDGSWQSALFIFELSVSAIVPALLLGIGRVRNSAVGLGACATMTVLGMIGYRFDVCIVAFARPEGASYFPSWMEVVVSLGIVASAVLVFVFFVKRLKVYPGEESAAQVVARPGPNPSAIRGLLPASLANVRRSSLAAVVAAALTIAALPEDALSGDQLEATPVSAARTVEGLVQRRTDGPGRLLAIAGPTGGPSAAEQAVLLAIDGNRDGRLVLFHHDGHIRSLGGQASCARCHHQRLPFTRNTRCSACHRDMYARTDIFDHGSHVAKLGGNAGCTRCHPESTAVKTRATAVACARCHAEMVERDSLVKPPAGGSSGHATGYMDAMHGLCVPCHKEKAKHDPARFGRRFGACSGCHRGGDASALLRGAPYVAQGDGR